MLSRLWEPIEDTTRRRRGGWRQQMAIDHTESVEPSSMSHLCWRQMLLWSSGDISASRLQETMADAMRDGLNHPMVVRVAQVGEGGHAHVGLMTLLENRTQILDQIGR
eukprot:70312-Pyramimonas_sp.AAC.1